MQDAFEFASRNLSEQNDKHKAANSKLLPVGVNDSITVSFQWELTSVSMHYSQGTGIHTPLSRLVLYPRSVCVCVCYWSV